MSDLLELNGIVIAETTLKSGIVVSGIVLAPAAAETNVILRRPLKYLRLPYIVAGHAF